MSATASAVPQLAGRERPAGSVLYLCAGTNEHSARCGKLLFVWIPSSLDSTERAGHGAIEIKCRRCKTLNTVQLELPIA